MGVVQNYGSPKLPLRRAFGTLWRPAESGHGIVIMFSCTYFV